jgi:hypothetical protein
MALDPVSAALDIGGKVIDRLWPNPAEAAAAKLELLKLQQSGELAQLTADTQIATAQAATNTAEASAPDLLTRGWRPFIGWICGLGLAVQFLVAPIATWAATLMGHALAFPQLDMGTLMTLLFGMLGLGTLRTAEKIKGKA